MHTKQFKIIKGAADIQKAIASIQNRGAKLDTDIHVAGVSVLKHIAEHGDTTLADRLVAAMPKGSRRVALVEWMLAFGQVHKLDPKLHKEAIAAGRLFSYAKDRKYDEQGAIGTTWTEFRKKELDVHAAFDAQAAVQSVLKRLKAAQASMSVENRASALESARALVALLEAPAAQEAPL